MTSSNQNTSSEGTSNGHDPKPGGNPKETPEQKLEDDLAKAKQEAKHKVRKQAESGQHHLASEADALSNAIDAAASKLDDQDREGLARYARELSGNLADAAGKLEDRSVDELANDAKRLAQDNPALFMLGSIAVGFGLSRFFKASAHHEHHDISNTRNRDKDSGTTMRKGERGQTENYKTSAATRNGDGRGLL